MAVTLTQTFDVDDPNAPVLILTFVGDGSDLSATAVSDAYQKYLRGYYLHTVTLYSATDDAFTFTLSDTYSTMFTQTTTSATSGELGTPDDRYKVNDQLYAAIANLANGGTAIVKCTFA